MLFRKVKSYIKNHLESNSNKVLVIDGARQVGKTFIIREIGKELFENYIEINLLEDSMNTKLFKDINSVEDFYIRLSTFAGDKMKAKDNTLVFLDEIQEYPYLLTFLKFLKNDNRFNYIASGSLLGVTLGKTVSIPIGSIEIKRMYPLDFEEFLIANGFGNLAIDSLRDKYKKNESLDEGMHNKVLDLFKKFIIVGGLPDSVNEYIESKNVYKVHKIQSDIHDLYISDASKYDRANRLKIKRVYEMIPSNLENKKKRVVMKDIENKKGKRFNDYEDEFDYIINSGIALEVKAISNPKFPLIESEGKNLLKLYLNDVGILSNILYRTNIMALINNQESINLGSVYESVVASELISHSHKLFYYDNKTKGEVDFLIDNYENLTVLPIEVKSGKDYNIHSALSKFVGTSDYGIKKAIVLSNEREIKHKSNITYLPIYFSMFI
jgi:uncharacterized protein